MVERLNGKNTNALMDKLLQKGLKKRFQDIFKSVYEQEYNLPPIAALMDISSDCNLNCHWCIDKKALSRNYLQEQTALKLLDELKDLNVKSIVYCGGGEPLLHPKFGKILEHTKELEIDCAVYTNGIELKTFIKEILNCAKWCRVSIDAGSAQTYYQLHKKDHFSEIISGICALKRESDKFRNDFSLGLSFIVMQENYKEIVEATELAQKIGCDFIQFKPLMIDHKVHKSVISYSQELIDNIKQSLSASKAKEEYNFSVLITNPLRDALGANMHLEVKHYHKCYVQNLIPMITPDGVYVCPNWRGCSRKSYGDVHSKSFKEIWFSAERKFLCRTLDPQIECNFPCIRHRINALFKLIEMAQDMDINLFEYLTEIDENHMPDRYFI